MAAKVWTGSCVTVRTGAVCLVPLDAHGDVLGWFMKSGSRREFVNALRETASRQARSCGCRGERDDHVAASTKTLGAPRPRAKRPATLNTAEVGGLGRRCDRSLPNCFQQASELPLEVLWLKILWLRILWPALAVRRARLRPRPSRQCRWATMSAPHSERQRASLRTQRTSLAWIRRWTSGSTGASWRMRKEEGRKLGGGSRGTSRRMRPAEGSCARMPHFAASVPHCYDRDQLKPFGFPSCHRQ